MRYSEAIKKISLENFKRKSELKYDAERYCLKMGWDMLTCVNHVALRLAFVDTIISHVVTDGVVRKIKQTEIVSMPYKLPDFLKNPFIIEARQNSVLLEDINAIAGYISDGDLFLIASFIDGASFIEHVKGSFDGRKLQDINFAPIVRKYRNEKRTDCIAFAIILALLLEAEKSPVIIEGKKQKNSANQKIKNDYKSDWIERRIYMDTKYVPAFKKLDGEHEELDKEGKILKQVHVKGFLRYQACGEGFKDRKWVYIEGFDSHRWTENKHTRIIVDHYESSKYQRRQPEK